MDIFSETVENAENEIQREKNASENTISVEGLEDEMRNLESLVAIDPSVKSTPEYQDLMARIEKAKSSQASKEDEEEEESEEEDDEDEEEDDEDEEEDDEDEEEDDEDEEEDPADVFGIKGKNNTKKQKEVKINFEVPKEMASLLSARYGIKDASTFFGSVDKWREQAQDGAENTKKLEMLSADIKNLPPDIRQSISLWADGEDYTAVFTQGLRLDFGSNFEEQDVESLVEQYLPEEYDSLLKSLQKEDISEDDFNDKIDLLARSTKRMFNEDKQALVDQRVKYEKEQADIEKRLKSSALDSIEKLSKAYPNFSKTELNKVKSVLVDGKIDSLLYNADGSYVEDVAEKIADLMYAKKMRESIEKRATRKGKSEANQEIVDSSPKKMKKKTSSNGQNKSNIGAVQHLSSVIVNDDPYA